MTPGRRQAKACDPASIDAMVPGSVEDQDLLAIRRRVVGVEIGAPGGRREPVGQARVGEDRVAVRLDDVDRPRSGVGRHARRETEDVDHLAGRVIGDPCAGRRQRLETEPGPAVDRAVLGRVATDRDDVVARLLRPAGRRIQLRVCRDRSTIARPCAPPSSGMVDRRAAPSGAMNSTPFGRDRDPRHRLDRDAGQCAIRDRLVEVGPRRCRCRPRRGRRSCRSDVGHARHVVGRVRSEDVGQALGKRLLVRVRVDHGGERRASATRRQVGDPRQLDRSEDARTVQVDRRQGVEDAAASVVPSDTTMRWSTGGRAYQLDRREPAAGAVSVSIRSRPSVAIRPSP